MLKCLVGCIIFNVIILTDVTGVEADPWKDSPDENKYRVIKTTESRSGERLAHLHDLLTPMKKGHVDQWSHDTIFVSTDVIDDVIDLLRRHRYEFKVMPANMNVAMKIEQEHYLKQPLSLPTTPPTKDGENENEKTKRSRRWINRFKNRFVKCYMNSCLTEDLGGYGEADVSSFRNQTVDLLLSVVKHYFLNYSQIESWLNIMGRLFPEVISIKHYGRSYENRTLTYAKIGLGNWNKPIIFIEAGVHAREWGSVTSALHIIKKLLIGYRKNEERLVHLLRRFDFYVIPVCNPDGYDYTFGPDFLHRVWRKTRSKTTAENCVGVDMNRNFYRAKGDKHGVYSMNQCMEDYPGKRPASEVETTHLIRLLNSIRHRVKGYYSVHTFGQLWFIPYAYSNNLFPVFKDMVRVSEFGARQILKQHGVKFKVGNVYDLVGYLVSGCSTDWVQDYTDCKFTFCLEMTDFNFSTAQHTSIFPFSIDVSEIEHVGEQLYTAISSFIEYIDNTSPRYFWDIPMKRTRLRRDRNARV